MVRELPCDRWQRPFRSPAAGTAELWVAAGHLNPGELRAFLSHPHGAMPDLALSRAEIDDLIAYIEGLR